MTSSTRLWSIVLAAGDGSRLAELTRNEQGEAIPKQYWTFDGVSSMLRWTLDRITPLVPESRIVPVVAEAHRRWWDGELRDIPRSHIVVQPRNRGTAAGILLPLLRIVSEDPDATVFVTPSDHFVADPDPLWWSVSVAEAAVRRDPERRRKLRMLGTPPAHRPGYGRFRDHRGRLRRPQ